MSTRTIGEAVNEAGRPTFDCETHGRIEIDKWSITPWSKTHWFVFCPGCRKWLRFDVG